MINPDNIPIKNVQRKEGSFEAQNTDAVKPKSKPNTKRDFQEIIGDDDNSDLQMELEKAKKGSPLGKMAAKSGTKSGQSNKSPSSGLSIFDLPKMSKDKSLDSLTLDAESKTPSFGKLKDEGSGASKQNLFDSPFAQSMPDISFVNPLAGAQTAPPTNAVFSADKVEMVSNPSPIQDIVEQMIDKLSVMTYNGQTDTTVTLNTPGAFNGTIIVLSQFDSANGQVNISFENLTQQAKLLLDTPANRESLVTTLSKEGYLVQQITTTTIVEHAPIVMEAQQQQGFAQEEADQQQQQQQQQQRDEAT